ncbi:hypothetical protein [Halorubrum ruber]|uniref:Uncharacterized protein n=1 Tax=Halorubrum ruber TaxID=2982524 RepID=A0A8T8LNY6_9EURY|nr:hypothetical protein [Halorubrum ruber]QUO48992.1 hypothetical protein J7656_06570 [Halorubrum ruber]
MSDLLSEIIAKLRPEDGLDWHGFIVGAVVAMVIAVLFQPYLATAATNLKVSVGAPGYQEPNVDVSVNEMPVIYPENVSVDDFDGLKWKEDYSLYRVQIENTADKPVEDVELSLRLPGCSIYTNLEGPGITEGMDSDNYIQPRITFDLEPPDGYENRLSTLGCTKQIEISNLPSNEVRTVEYVVTREFSRCDFISGYKPTPEYNLTYQWTADSEEYGVELSDRVSGLDDDYESARSPGGVGIQTTLYPSNGEVSYAYLVNVSAPSLEEGMKKCVYTPTSSNITASR